MLFGDSMHPGGLTLTQEFAKKIGITKNSKVLDLACGKGTTPIFMAKHFGCEVTGLDYGSENIEFAKQISAREGLTERVDFRVGDAEDIQFEGETFDFVLCECSFCLFPDKGKAASEIYRVLKKNGKIGLSDIVVRGVISQNIRDALNRFVCLLEAESEAKYIEYLDAVGFGDIRIFDKKFEILALLDDTKKRVFAAELLKGLGKLDLAFDFDK